MRMNCPPIEQLLAVAQNALSVGETESIQAHLDAGCWPCRRQLSQLRQLCSITDEWMLREPPAWLQRQAMILFDQQAPSRPRPLRRILGLLVVNHVGDEILLGFRHTRRTTRQMLYRAGEYDIDLCLNYGEPSRAVEITGQANPRSGQLETVAGAPVHLVRHAEVVAATQANEFGAFFIDDTPEGIYDLSIQLKDEEIYIAGLEVVAPSH